MSRVSCFFPMSLEDSSFLQIFNPSERTATYDAPQTGKLRTTSKESHLDERSTGTRALFRCNFFMAGSQPDLGSCHDIWQEHCQGDVGIGLFSSCH